jgi:hypothetical protein
MQATHVLYPIFRMQWLDDITVHAVVYVHEYGTHIGLKLRYTIVRRIELYLHDGKVVRTFQDQIVLGCIEVSMQHSIT